MGSLGAMYWATGSAIAKNMMPVPIPAAKSMAAHEKVEKSGVELLGPRRTAPKREKASPATKTRTAVTSRM